MENEVERRYAKIVSVSVNLVTIMHPNDVPRWPIFLLILL